jgi:hypothetical protein
MKLIQRISIYQLIILSICVFMTSQLQAATCFPGTPTTVAPGGTVAVTSTITVFNSTERGGSATADRDAVDLQDDTWVTAASANGLGLQTRWSPTAAVASTTSPITLFSSINTTSVTAQLKNMNGLEDTVNGGPCDGGTAGSAGVETNSTNQLQDSSPMPTSLFVTPPASAYFWNEGGGATTNRNAVVFTFSQPVKAFGTWFGDLETRTDNSPFGGRPAIVRLLDAAGNRIGEDVKIQGTTSESDTVCGSDGTAPTHVACGNRVTRWIGFVDNSSNTLNSPTTLAVVKSMVVVVGDDDDSNPVDGGDGTTVDGNTEHLSFVGATLRELTPTAASGSIVGRAMTSNRRGILNATITLTDTVTGEVRTARTNSFGYYHFDDVAVGSFYILTANRKGYTFANNTQSLQLFSDSETINFVANP